MLKGLDILDSWISKLFGNWKVGNDRAELPLRKELDQHSSSGRNELQIVQSAFFLLFSSVKSYCDPSTH